MSSLYVLYTMLGARVEIIVYATHSLVVERSITNHISLI